MQAPLPAIQEDMTEVDTGQRPDRAGRNTTGPGEDKIEAREGRTAKLSGEGRRPETS